MWGTSAWLFGSQERRHFFFSSRRRHTRCSRDWSSDVCSSDLVDHVDDHVVDEPAFLEGLGDRVALADRLVDALIAALEDHVGARLANDGEGLENRQDRKSVV